MKVVQRKSVRGIKVRIQINIPAWVYKELGFELGDDHDWILLEDDNGKRMVALIRVPKEEEEEGEEKKGEEEGGKEKEGEERGK